MYGVAEALKLIYREYDKNNFLYESDKVDADLAMSAICSLIVNIKNKDILPRSHIETFDFMVDHLTDSLYE